MATRQSELLRVLSQLKADLGDPEWVALVDERGLVLASVPEGPEVDLERVAAMTATLLISGERVIAEIGGGVLRYVVVAGSDRQQMIVLLSAECVLTLGLPPEISPRSTFKPMARWAPEIMEVLEMKFADE